MERQAILVTIGDTAMRPPIQVPHGGPYIVNVEVTPGNRVTKALARLRLLRLHVKVTVGPTGGKE